MRPAPTRAETPWSTLVETPQCPKCGTPFHGIDVDARPFELRLGCRAKGCNQRWWIMGLTAGDVAPQLVHVVDEIETAPLLMVEYGLPVRVERVMYWQVALTPNQVHRRCTEIEQARTRGVRAPSFPFARRGTPAPAA